MERTWFSVVALAAPRGAGPCAAQPAADQEGRQVAEIREWGKRYLATVKDGDIAAWPCDY